MSDFDDKAEKELARRKAEAVARAKEKQLRSDEELRQSIQDCQPLLLELADAVASLRKRTQAPGKRKRGILVSWNGPATFWEVHSRAGGTLWVAGNGECRVGSPPTYSPSRWQQMPTVQNFVRTKARWEVDQSAEGIKDVVRYTMTGFLQGCIHDIMGQILEGPHQPRC